MCIYVCIYALYRKKYDSIDVKKNSNNEKVLYTKNLKICIYDTPNYLKYHEETMTIYHTIIALAAQYRKRSDQEPIFTLTSWHCNAFYSVIECHLIPTAKIA